VNPYVDHRRRIVNPYRINARPRAPRPSRLAAFAAFVCTGIMVAPVIAMLTNGCQQVKVAAPLLEPAGACIVTQLLDGGATDPLAIVAACAGVTIDDVIQVIETLMAAQPDAGLADGGVTPTAARLAAVHVRAVSIRASRSKP